MSKFDKNEFDKNKDSKTDDEFLDELLNDKEDDLDDLDLIKKDNIEDFSKESKSLNKKDSLNLSSDNKPSKPKKKSGKKLNPNKKVLKGFLFGLSVSLVIILLGSFCIKREIFSNGRVGVRAVKLLYQFKNINELEDNLKGLERMMTKKCYYDTTVLNSSKSLNTYLKFKKQKTTVNILEQRPGFILYSLDNPNLTGTRLFIFSYDVNYLGKINKVREFEAIDFYGTYNTIPNQEELDKLMEEWNKGN